MWDLDNSTDYGAERNWIRDKDGVHSWIVAVRATFDIAPDGAVHPSEEQPDPIREPLYRGDPGRSSALLDSDLLGRKFTTDVVLDANAYAPKGEATDRVEASLRIDELIKTIVVFGPRVYRRGPTGPIPSVARPFTVQPITYELAFGGTDLRKMDPSASRMDARNPVGRGVWINPDEAIDQPAHQIEYPAGRGGSGPAGFGPIASYWSPRRERAGTYGETWEHSKRPLLPDDYDPLFTQSAPDDQRNAAPLRGGETVVLTNMSPEGRLSFVLPRLQFEFRTVFPFGAVDHRGVLTTVFIVPHARKLTMLWQSVLPVRALDTDYLDFTFIAESPTA